MLGNTTLNNGNWALKTNGCIFCVLIFGEGGQYESKLKCGCIWQFDLGNTIESPRSLLLKYNIKSILPKIVIFETKITNLIENVSHNAILNNKIH